MAPPVCFILATLLLQNYPDLATGLILIGTVPCAGMAMVWTGMLKGNVPLSVVIDASTMILAPFLIPGIMLILAGSYVHISVGEMFKDLIITVLFPVCGGIVSRWVADKSVFKKHHKAKDYLGVFPSISALMAILLMFMVINISIKMILKHIDLLPSLTASTILVFPTMFAVAWLLSKKLFDYDSSIAITSSSGMKNLPIAMGIAITSFSKMTALPIAISFIFQMLTAVMFYRLFKSHGKI